MFLIDLMYRNQASKWNMEIKSNKKLQNLEVLTIRY
jgi:hypothetical protein